MTDDAKNLLRECLQYLYESAPAEVYDRITAHLAAPAPEPVAWAYLWPEKEEPEFHRVRLSQESRNARQKMKVIERPLIYADAAPADQWRRVEDAPDSDRIVEVTDGKDRCYGNCVKGHLWNYDDSQAIQLATHWRDLPALPEADK